MVSGTYSQGGWLGTVSTRMIGAAHLVNFWRSGVNVDNNDIPFYWYFDLRMSYRFGNGVSVYGAIDNVFDKSPEVIDATPWSKGSATNGNFYDVLGRTAYVGASMRF